MKRTKLFLLALSALIAPAVHALYMYKTKLASRYAYRLPLLPAIFLSIILAMPLQAQYAFGPQIRQGNSANNLTYDIGTGVFQYTDPNSDEDASALPLAGSATQLITVSQSWTATVSINIAGRTMGGVSENAPFVYIGLIVYSGNVTQSRFAIALGQVNNTAGDDSDDVPDGFYGIVARSSALRNGSYDVVGLLGTSQRPPNSSNDLYEIVSGTNGEADTPVSETIGPAAGVLDLSYDASTKIMTGYYNGTAFCSYPVSAWGASPPLKLAVYGASEEGAVVLAGTALASNFSVAASGSARLFVQTNGDGAVSPNETGRLLRIGSSYKLTAVPAKNWLFSNWVASGSESFVSNNSVLKFTMQSNLVLTANFVTNLFLAAQGAYHGLFAPAGGVREETNSGSFALNLLGTGAFTGDLFLGSKTVNLAGKFDVGGYAQTSSMVKGGSPLTTMIQLDFANQAVSGTVTDGSFVAQLDGDRNVFGPGHPATDYAGQYTWTITGTDNALVGPYGTSYGTLTVSPVGDITFAGRLADGTTFSQSSAVSKDGRWPMYLPSSNPNESVFGWNYFTNQTLTAPSLVSWINVTNKAKSALYASGFTNQTAAILASYYNPTERPLLSLTEAQVTLEGGDLPFGITNQITLTANNAISVPVAVGNTNKLKLTITPKTGLITGSFQNPANAKQTITISGVLLQNQTNAQGYFLGTNQSGTFLFE